MSAPNQLEPGTQESPLVYEVRYDSLDDFKRRCAAAALKTRFNISSNGLEDVVTSRGESAHVVRILGTGICIALIVESLGTKELVADKIAKLDISRAMFERTGNVYDQYIGEDTVQMAANDIITVGAEPFDMSFFVAVGDEAYLMDKIRMESLLNGVVKACNDGEFCWGGGETPKLSGPVDPATAVYACAMNGIIRDSVNPLIEHTNLKAGDIILAAKSSGPHANGYTMLRGLADRLPNSYLTKLPSGRTYGDAILQPTKSYVRLMRTLNRARLATYAVNWTGHAIRKLMRAPQNLTYVVNNMPQPQEVFTFVQEKAQQSTKDMYKTFNMGLGLAIFTRPKDKDLAIHAGSEEGHELIEIGRVEEGPKQVRLVWQGIDETYDDLNIR